MPLRARWCRAAVARDPDLRTRRHHRAYRPVERIHDVRQRLASIVDGESEDAGCRHARGGGPGKCLLRALHCGQDAQRDGDIAAPAVFAPDWSSIASKMPDDIRIVVEAVLEDNWQQLEDRVKQMEDEAKLTNERKDMVIESKDKLIAHMEYMQKLNEKLIAHGRDMQEWTESRLEQAKVKRLDDLRRYQIVYEPLDTINWLLRGLYPWNRSGPEALFNQLMDDIVDKATGTLQPAFKQQYNELAAVFEEPE
ncbi:hypothetical protein KFE25_000516 [Diacronema lutheri]|uniref:Uncharacterized protein n=1 Tax=Diacronema lutheri TaxID=2081491 RepID=A0A8J5XXF3_DIALT|nr:hypothetical protein KFE25_000516 [Diacronema lutheri]